MTVVFVYIFYASLNIYSTPALDDLSQIVDAQGHLQAYIKGQEGVHPIVANSMHRLQEGSIPVLYDLPIGLVGQVLYGGPEVEDG